MRLGRTEKRVLKAILESRNAPERYRSRCRRYGRQPGAAILIDVRDRVWGESVTPAQRAAFSRALRTLEEKGLIKAHGATRTMVRLTPEGEQKVKALNVNNVACAAQLTSTSPGEEAA